MTHILCNAYAQKIVRSPHFRFDEMKSSMPIHSILPSYYSVIYKLKIGEIKEYDLSTASGEFYFKYVRFFTLPLPPNKSPLNESFVDGEVHKILLLSRLTGNHPWKYLLPRVCHSNCYIVKVEDDKTISGDHVTDALDLLQ